jgi:bifunctional non-homologous end joining protein LigD
MITHPEKVLFPDSGVTKGELCAYYEAVAPHLLPHVSGRPVTMERYPAGIARKGFIQKDVAKGFPDWLSRVAVPRRDASEEPVHYPVVTDARSLVWLANQNSVTPHVWASRVPELERPDVCVIDLDPAEQSADELRVAALAVRDALEELKLPSFVKTSGSKGFHIVVSLEPSTTFEDSWLFAHGLGAVLVKRHPRLFTQEFIKADREGRILIDTGRNLRGATFAAVYAVRAKAGAPVSAPCRWEELERGEVEPQTFRLRNMAARLWQALPTSAQSLHEPTERLKSLLGESEWQEAFAASTRRPVSRKRGKRP